MNRHTKAPWFLSGSTVVSSDKATTIAIVNPDLTNANWIYDGCLMAESPILLKLLKLASTYIIKAKQTKAETELLKAISDAIKRAECDSNEK